MDSQPDADHATHRETAEMDAVEAQRIEQPEDIATQLFDGVVSWCNRRLPMAASVVTQDPEVRLQFRHLRVPHGKISAQRIREYQYRPLVTSKRVVCSQFCDVDKRHGLSLAYRAQAPPPA